MVKALTVYKASAGSGKTFTLATEYIRLLVENPQSYRSILAVTFTNKATEEMKMRILSQLYGIWKQLPDSVRYLEAVRQKTGLSPEIISQRAGIGLANLLHNYSYFRVETIDTFFQSVLRNMARELDLTTNLRIGLNDYQVEEMAVDRLIEDLTTQDVLLQWMMRYIMENISDDKSWNIIGQVKTFGRTIFRDDYKKVSKALEQRLAEPGFFDRYTSRLKDIRQAAEERMTGIAQQFFDILESECLTVDDFSYGKTGVCSLFLKLQQGIFDESIVGKRVTDSLGDPAKWYKKTHPSRDLLHTLADGPLGDLLRTALEERPRQWKLYKSADLTLRHLSQLRLLGSIEKKVRELNEDANRFLLSDTQQLLHSLIDGSDSPFIFEKIGTQLEHVMIDEFQDTSTVQWRNFKVLLSEAMSHEDSSNLIVGDVKQSIYRWRSGDWRLLNNIETEFSARQIETLPLDTNYRSERNVITFNNVFFRHAVEIEYLAQKELNDAEAEQLRKAYADVEQKIPKDREEKGWVSVTLLPADDYQEQVLQLMADHISQLTGAGIPQTEMAILVRTNALIPVIAQYFAEQMPEVSIVSDEAFRLDASCAVCMMVNALRLLIHPDDQLTRAAIAKSYQTDVLGNDAPDNELLLSTCDLDALLPEPFAAHLQELITLPLYDLIERLYAIFGLQRLSGQSAYVCAFFDQVTAFVNDNSAGIDAFLTEWEESLCGKTIQSDVTSGIRLISIHKSKGLEFDHVICPFCDWQLEKQNANILWCQPKEAPFSDLPIAPIDFSRKQMMGTIYEDDYCQEHLQNTVDNLNLLYVAFTRAKRSLIVIGKRNAKNSRSAIIEQCLPLVANDAETQTATLEGLEDDQSPITFTYGQPASPNLITHTSHLIPHTSPNPFLQPSVPHAVEVRNFESKVSFRQSNRSQAFAEGDDEENAQRRNYIQTGSVLHEIFSTIRTVDDIPAALQSLQFEGVLYDEHITADRLTAMLRKRLSDPRVADWFFAGPKTSGDRSGWQLFNECTILKMEEDGEVRERRPDRVITNGREWIVIDYKFGHPRPEYAAQVREYMSLIASMGHQNIKGYLWYVYSNQIEEVR